MLLSVKKDDRIPPHDIGKGTPSRCEALGGEELPSPPLVEECLFGISEAPVIEGYRDSFFALPHRFSEKIFIKCEKTLD